MKLLFALVSALALGGCLQSVDVTVPPDGATGGDPDAPFGGNDATADTTNAGGDTGTPVFPECDPNAGTPVDYTSQANLESMLVGRWRQCSGGHLLGGPGQGIEFLPDHTFYMLVTSDSSGTLVRATGISSRGTWSTSDCASAVGPAYMCQLNVMINGGGDGGHPSFTNSPRQMLLPTSATAAYPPPFFAAIP